MLLRLSALAALALAALPLRAQSPCAQTKLIPIPKTKGFGWRVDVDGTRLAATASFGNANLQIPNRALLFELGPDGWTQIAALVSPSEDKQKFGSSISIDGAWLAVGAAYETLGGTVHLFREVGGSYFYEQQLVASDAQFQEEFGLSVDLDGGFLAVGAPADFVPGKGVAVGSVYVFEFDGAQWNETAKVQASDGEALERFGEAIALQDGRLIVGVYKDHLGPMFDAGSVYVYEFDGAQWNETQKLLEPVPNFNGYLGRAVALDGDLLAASVSVPVAQGSTGGAHLYRLTGGSWTWEATVINLDGKPDQRALALDGERIALATHSGGDLVTVYSKQAGAWALEATFSSSTLGQYGWNVALDGDRLVVGAHSDDNPVGFSAGAVYVENLAATPDTYCTAKTTSNGCVPVIDSAGAPSANGLTPFPISAREVPNQKPGLLFYGRSGPAALPFLGGTLCVLPPLVRTPVQSSGGNPPPADCSGAYALDFATIAPGDPNLAPGDAVHAQYWFRDPAHPDGTGVALSDALAFELCD